MSDEPLAYAGRSVADWLPRLFAESADERGAARDALNAMLHPQPRASDAERAAWTRERYLADERRFHEAFAAALLAPMFDGRGFLERVFAELAEIGKSVVRMGEGRTGVRRALGRRRGGLVGVVAAAGEALLRWPDLAWSQLAADDLFCAGTTCTAIGTLGSRGLPFAGDLFARVGRPPSEVSRTACNALAKIGADDRATIARLAELSRETGDSDVVQALSVIGPSTLHVVPRLVDDLMPAYDADDHGAAYRVRQLTRIDSTRRDLFDRAVALSRPSPPRIEMRTPSSGRPYGFDGVMVRRAHAFSAMSCFTAFADEAAAALVESMHTFREFDAMYDYGLGRIRTMLEHLGRLDAATPDALRQPPTPPPAGG